MQRIPRRGSELRYSAACACKRPARKQYRAYINKQSRGAQLRGLPRRHAATRPAGGGERIAMLALKTNPSHVGKHLVAGPLL